MQDFFVPNQEQQGSVVAQILFSQQLGRSLTLDTQQVPLVPSRPLGQAGVQIAANISTGNLFIEDHQIALDDGGWQLKFGMVFNSQGVPQWRFNLGRRITQKNTSQIEVTLDDGGKLLFTSSDGTNFSAQTPSGNFELTKNADSSFTLLDPASGICSHFSNNGFEERREDATGIGLTFHYDEHGDVAHMFLPSGRNVQWIRQHSPTGAIVTLSLLDQEGIVQQDLLAYQFNLQQQVQKTRIPLGTRADYEISYQYDDQLSDLKSITQTDQTVINFTYGIFQGKKSIYDINDGEGRNLHFAFNDNQRQWTLGQDAKNTVTATLDAAQRLQTLSQPILTGLDIVEQEVTTLEYSAGDRISKIIYHDQSTKNFEYSAKTGKKSSYTDSAGSHEETIYHPVTGDKVAIVKLAFVEGESQVVTEYFVYDDQKHLRYHISALGCVTQYLWDQHFSVISEERTKRNVAFDVTGYSADALPSLEDLETWWASENDHSNTTLVQTAYNNFGQRRSHRRYAKVDVQGNGIVTDALKETQWPDLIPTGEWLQQVEFIASQQSRRIRRQLDGLKREILSTNSRGEICESTYFDAEQRYQIAHRDAQSHTYRLEGSTWDQSGLTLGHTEQDLVMLGAPALTTTYQRDPGTGCILSTTTPTALYSHVYTPSLGLKHSIQEQTNHECEFDYDVRHVLKTQREVGGADTARINVTLRDVSQNNRYEIDGDRYVTEYVYDGAHRHIETIRYAIALLETVTLQLTATGILLGIIQSIDDRRDVIFRNRDGDEIGSQNHWGYVCEYVRDFMGRLCQSRRYKQAVPTLNTWDALKASAAQADPEPELTVYQTDLLGNYQMTIDPEQFVIEQRWLGNGQWSQLIRKNQDSNKPDHVETREFDGESFLRVHEIQPKKIRHCYTPDVHNQVADSTTTDLITQTVVRHTETKRDGLARIIQTLGPRTSQKQTKVYDPDTGFLRYQENSFGARTVFYKDPNGKTVALIDPNGFITRYTYNIFGERKVKRQVANALLSDDLEVLTGGQMTPEIDQLLCAYQNDENDIITSKDYNNRGLLMITTDGDLYQTTRNINAFQEADLITQDVDHQSGVILTKKTTIQKTKLPNGGCQRVATEDPGGLNIGTLESLNHQDEVAYRKEPNGAEHDFTYDSKKNVESHRDRARGATQTWQRDHLEREIAHTNFQGKKSTTGYDDSQRLRTHTTPLNQTQQVIKNALDQDETYLNTARYQHQVLRNAAGDLTHEIDEDTLDTEHVPNAEGFEEFVIFPGQALIHRHEFYPGGQIKFRKQCAGGQTYSDFFQNNVAGHPVFQEDATGAQHNYAYDKRQHRTQQSTKIKANGDTVIQANTFNAVVSISSTTHSSDQQTFKIENAVDVLGRVIQKTRDPQGLKLSTLYQYDCQGHATQITDALNHKHWSVYDLMGNLRFTVSPLGIVHEYRYDVLDQKSYDCVYDHPIATSTLTPTTTPQDVQALLAPKMNDRSQVHYYFYNDDQELCYTVTGLGIVTETLYNAARVVCGTYRYANAIDASQLQVGDITSVHPISNVTQDRMTLTIFNKANQKPRYSMTAEGQVTEYVLDAKNNPVQIIRYAKVLTLDEMKSATLDTIALLLQSDDPSNLIKYQVFDDFNRLAYVIDENYYVSGFEYNEAHLQVDAYVYPQPLTTWPAQLDVNTLRGFCSPQKTAAYHTHTTYDELQRKFDHSVGDDPAEHWQYDALNHVRVYIDQCQFDWQTTYDDAGRKIQDDTPVTTIYQIQNDPANPGGIKEGNISRDRRTKKMILDAGGHLRSLVKGALSDVAQQRMTRHDVDADGRCTAIYVDSVTVDDSTKNPKNPGDLVTQVQTVSRRYVYNTSGKVIVNIDEDNQPHFKIYDADQRLVYEIQPNGNVRHYLRNSFGETDAVYHYATKIQLNLTQHMETGLTIADIEASGVLIKTDQDRMIALKFSRTGQRLETGLPPQLLAWVEADHLKWSVSVGRTTRKLYDAFDREVGELRLIHGKDESPNQVTQNNTQDPNQFSWQLTYHWLDGCGNPLLTVQSVDGAVFNAVQYTRDHRGFILNQREFSYQFTLAELFVGEGVPLPYASVLLTLLQHVDSAEDHYYVYQRDVNGRELSKTLVQEIVQSVTSKSIQQENGTVIVPDQLAEETQDLTWRNLSFDPRTGKPTQTQSPGGAITDYKFDELAREAGQTGPFASTGDPFAKAGDPLHPSFTREQQTKGYNALDKDPVYDVLTFNAFDSNQNPLPGPVLTHVALQLNDMRGLPVIKQDRNGHAKHTTYTPGRRVARHYWFREIHEQATQQSGVLSAIKRLFSTAQTSSSSQATKKPMQHQFKYDDNGNRIERVDVNFDGRTTTLYVKFNIFDEPIAMGPDGVNWPKTILPGLSGTPIVEVGDDGVTRVKLVDGLGNQVAQIQKPEGDDLAQKVQSQADLLSLLTDIKKKVDYHTTYQLSLWRRNFLGQVLEKSHPTYTIKTPQTPEPFYTALEVGTDYPEFGAYSITWPTPTDRFLTGQIILTESQVPGAMPLVLDIQAPAGNLRSGVDASRLPTGYYDYEIWYQYHAALGGGNDLRDRTPRTYRAVGQALPVITSNQREGYLVARILNYNQLVIGCVPSIATLDVAIYQDGAFLQTVPASLNKAGCYTADLSRFTTGYYSFCIPGKDVPIAANQLVLTAIMPPPGQLTPFEVTLPQLIMTGDCKLDMHNKHHYKKPDELCWQINDNVAFTGYDPLHPLLASQLTPEVVIDWSAIANLSGEEIFDLLQSRAHGIPHIYSNIQDARTTDYSHLITDFVYNSVMLRIQLQGEWVPLIEVRADLQQTMTPSTEVKTPEAGFEHTYVWQRNAKMSGSRIIFAGLPAGVASFLLTYKDFSLYAGPHVIHSHDRWRDISSMGILTKEAKFLVVNSEGIPPGEVDYVLILKDSAGHQLAVHTGTMAVTHGKNAIPVPRQTEKFSPVRPRESQAYNAHGNVVSQTDAYRYEKIHKYNKRGKRIQTTYPPYSYLLDDGTTVTGSTSEQVGFNRDNHHIGTADQKGHVSERFVNEVGDSLGTRDADGVYLRHILDGFRDVIGVYGYDATNAQDPEHTVFSQREHDALKRVTSDTDRSGDALRFGRDDSGHVNHTTSRAGRESYANHDINDHEVERCNAAGQIIRTQSDKRGNLLEVDDGISLPMRYFRDFFGNFDMSQPVQMCDKSGVPYKIQLNNNKLLISQQSQMSSEQHAAGVHGHYYNPVSAGVESTPNQDLVYVRDEADHTNYILDNAANTRFQKFYDEANTCRGERYTNGDGLVCANTWIKFNPLGWITRFFDDVLQGEFQYDAKGNRRHTLVSVKENGRFLMMNQRESWFTYSDADRVQYDDCVMTVTGEIDLSYDEATGLPRGRVLLYGLDGRLMHELYKDKKDANGIRTEDVNTLRIDVIYNPSLTAYTLQCCQQQADGQFSAPVVLAHYKVDSDQVALMKVTTDHVRDITATQRYSLNPVGFVSNIDSQEVNSVTGHPIDGNKRPNTSQQERNDIDVYGQEASSNTYYPVKEKKHLQCTDSLTNHFIDVFSRQIASVTGQESVPKSSHQKPTDPQTVNVLHDPNGAVSARTAGSAESDGTRSFDTIPDGRIVLVRNDLANRSSSDFGYYFYDPRKGVAIGYYGNIPSANDALSTINFNLNYHPILQYFPPPSPGVYHTLEDATFSQISEIVYGSNRYADELATANGGGSGGTMVKANETITVPPLNTLSYNNVRDNAVLNASAILGTFDPELVHLMPHQKHHFLVELLDALVIIASVVASIMTGGGASATVVAVLEAILEQVAIAVTANLSIQGINLAARVQSHFDFKSLGISAVGAVAGAGANSWASGMAFLSRLSVYELTEMLNQMVDKALGLEKRLTWSGFVVGVLNSVNQGLDNTPLLQDHTGLRITTDTVFAGINATITGLDSKHHHVDVWTVAAEMIGTSVGERLQLDRAQSVSHLPKLQQTQGYEYDHGSLSMGEVALARTGPDYAVAVQQEAIATHKAMQLGLSHPRQAAALQQREEEVLAEAFNEYVNQASHFLWQHRDGIVAGFGMMGMAMGAAAPRFAQPAHESVVASVVNGTGNAVAQTVNDTIGFGRGAYAFGKRSGYDLGHPAQLESDAIHVGGSTKRVGLSMYHGLSHPRMLWDDVKLSAEHFVHEPLEDEVTTVIHGAMTTAVTAIATGGVGVFARGARVLGSVGAGVERRLPNVVREEENLIRPGTLSSSRAWTPKARINAAQLPNEGKMRFIPPKNYHPSIPLQKGPNGGYIDKFENEWIKGPSRTPGQPFEWDVQLSPLGRKQLGWATRDGSHLNVSLDGRITHR